MKKKLNAFGFFAITASMVMTVYEYPVFASSGFATLFYAVIAGIFWFIPVALIAAEFASIQSWQNEGIFTWVSKTLGNRYGFLAIFFQWFQITVGFITMIFFIVGALSYIFDAPILISNTLVYFIVVICILWLITISQFLGTKFTAKIAKIGFVFGILIPVSIMLLMGILYIALGNPLQIKFSLDTLIPNFTEVNTIVVFAGFVLAYMGIEASASHIDEIENPKKTFPLVMLMIAVLAIVLDSLGGIVLASVVPSSQLGANIGVIQGLEFLFKFTFDFFNISDSANLATIFSKVFAILISLGVIAEISSWVVGPSRGMFKAAKRGYLPKALAKENKYGVPVNFIVVQALISSIWAAVLVFGSNGSGDMSFLLAIGLTVILYLIAYLLFFIAYIVLILKDKALERGYSVPGGRIGKWLFAIPGLILSILTLIISMLPPSSLSNSEHSTYLVLIVISTIVSIVVPMLIYELYSKKNIIEDNKNE